MRYTIHEFFSFFFIDMFLLKKKITFSPIIRKPKKNDLFNAPNKCEIRSDKMLHLKTGPRLQTKNAYEVKLLKKKKNYNLNQ